MTGIQVRFHQGHGKNWLWEKPPLPSGLGLGLLEAELLLSPSMDVEQQERDNTKGMAQKQRPQLVRDGFPMKQGSLEGDVCLAVTSSARFCIASASKHHTGGVASALKVKIEQGRAPALK